MKTQPTRWRNYNSAVVKITSDIDLTLFGTANYRVPTIKVLPTLERFEKDIASPRNYLRWLKFPLKELAVKMPTVNVRVHVITLAAKGKELTTDNDFAIGKRLIGLAGQSNYARVPIPTIDMDKMAVENYFGINLDRVYSIYRAYNSLNPNTRPAVFYQMIWFPREHSGGSKDILHKHLALKQSPAPTGEANEYLSHFVLNESQLGNHHIQTIRAIARQIISSWYHNGVSWQYYEPIREITLKGYTDKSGEEDYNKGLGDRRAEEVKNRLIFEIDLLEKKTSTVKRVSRLLDVTIIPSEGEKDATAKFDPLSRAVLIQYKLFQPDTVLLHTQARILALIQHHRAWGVSLKPKTIERLRCMASKLTQTNFNGTFIRSTCMQRGLSGEPLSKCFESVRDHLVGSQIFEGIFAKRIGGKSSVHHSLGALESLVDEHIGKGLGHLNQKLGSTGSVSATPDHEKMAEYVADHRNSSWHIYNCYK